MTEIASLAITIVVLRENRCARLPGTLCGRQRQGVEPQGRMKRLKGLPILVRREIGNAEVVLGDAVGGVLEF